MHTFIASIEITHGYVKQHGLHLGTEEPLARRIVEDIFRNRITSNLPVVTVALMRDRKLVDVFYGDRWNSDIFDESFQEA